MNIKKVVKISALVILVCIILFISSLFVFSKFYGDKISSIVIEELNKKLNVKVSVQNVDFSVFKRFPDASIRLSGVVAHSSSTFNKKEFDKDADTLLVAKQLYLQFNILDILRKNYIISKIYVVDGDFRMYFDTDGHNNFKIFKDEKTSSKTSVSIDLKKVETENTAFRYIDKRNQFETNSFFEHILLKGRFSEKQFALESKVVGVCKSLKFNKNKLPPNIAVELDCSVAVNDSTYTITQCDFTFDEIETQITGVVQKKKNYYVNLKTEISNISITDLQKYMTVELQNKLKKWSPQGLLELKIESKGYITEQTLPELRVDFDLDKGLFSFEGKKASVEGKGVFKARNVYNAKTCNIVFDTLSCVFNNSTYNGHASINDFTLFHIKSLGQLSVSIPDLMSLSNKELPVDMKGIVEGRIAFEADLQKLDTINDHLFEKLNLKTDLKLHDGYFLYKANKFSEAHDIEASFRSNNDEYIIDTCNFNYFGTQMICSGRLSDLVTFIYSDYQTLNADLVVKGGCIDYNSIINSVPHDTSNIVIPKQYNVKVKFDSECLKYNKMSLLNLRGSLSFVNGDIATQGLSFFIFDGRINGDIYINQNSNQTFTVKTKLSTTNLHIDKVFSALNNFNQKTLQDKNIKGLFSGDVMLSTDLSNNFDVNTKSLLLECNAVITNGRLINFEPMKKLSRFIDVAELENVTFSTLKNNFIVKDEKLTIPQMEIKSSAFSLLLSGTHNFNNSFEYNIQLYLSELLSKKHKAKHPNEYFGEVLNDSQGQTRLPIKVTGNGDKINYVYDTKVAKENVKESLRKEKSELTKIFQEEFNIKGKKDTVNVQKKKPLPEDSQKFQIEFE